VRVVVTGGAGFIGSHVVDLMLAKHHQVTVIDNFSTGRRENLRHINDRIRMVEADIAESGLWQTELKGVDWVIHLAALADIVPSIQNPEEYFNSNVLGTLKVLEACKEYNVSKLIYSASSSCYGISDEYPTPENAKIDTQYPYALTKKMGEDLVLHWDKVYGLKANSLRFFNVYGTRSRTSGTYGAMFGVFLAQKLANRPFTVVGDGSQTRDFTYVTDVAQAVLSAVESSQSGHVYNVGSGKTVSVIDIARKLGGEVVFIPKRPGEPECTFADISEIKKDLGWQPTVDIDQGIKLVIDNIEYWRNAVVWTPDTIDQATKAWFDHLS
jgi:UDP-glucose 4-epimerase